MRYGLSIFSNFLKQEAMTSFIPNIIVSKFHSAREYLTPVLTVSQFYEKGQITPEEFMVAGDYLIRMSPHWAWARGDAARSKAYLSPDKQYLTVSNIPCRRRVRTVAATSDDEHGILSMFSSEPVYPSLPSSPATISSVRSINTADHATDDDEYGEITQFIEPSLHVTDTAAVGGGGAAGAVGTAGAATAVEDTLRLYELTIVYDNYYRTPRVFLRGYTPEGRPLGPGETIEDIMQDYIQKTATIEAHPHNGFQYISIHPCRHAETMKRITDVMIANNEGRQPPVQMYMFLFIKFIGSMIPTIEYDNTMPISV
jgi:ubiquitin-like-conjugating enzyme ATG3